jgi:hypothetical protein
MGKEERYWGEESLELFRGWWQTIGPLLFIHGPRGLKGPETIAVTLADIDRLTGAFRYERLDAGYPANTLACSGEVWRHALELKRCWRRRIWC